MNLRLFGYACLAVIASAILFCAIVLAWMVSDRKIPVVVHETRVLTPRLRPGEFLLIRQQVEYLRNCRAHVDRVVYDDHTHRDFPPDIDYERPPQGIGRHTITFRIRIPEDFVQGRGYYRATPVYACNFVQRYYWPITREDTVVSFEIIGEPIVGP